MWCQNLYLRWSYINGFSSIQISDSNDLRLSNPEINTGDIYQMYLSAFSGIISLAAALTTYVRPAYGIYTESSLIIDNIVSIEQTLNLFSRSVDTHDYALLDSIFTPDAVANFATPAGFIDGLSAIKTELQTALMGTVSQHTLSTHMISVAGGQATTASATTYLQGTFFGQGNLTGQIQTTYGR